MEEIKKLLKLPKLEYYKTHLSLINCILPVKMTPKEIEVLAHFMSLEGDISNYRFGKTARKIVRDQLELSYAGLSNYIGFLLDKGFLVEEADELNIRTEIKILPLLFPKADEQKYLFRLIKQENNNHDAIQ